MDAINSTMAEAAASPFSAGPDFTSGTETPSTATDALPTTDTPNHAKPANYSLTYSSSAMTTSVPAISNETSEANITYSAYPIYTNDTGSTSTSSAATTWQTVEGSPQPNNAGKTAGGVMAALCAIVLFGVAYWYWRRRQRTRSLDSAASRYGSDKPLNDPTPYPPVGERRLPPTPRESAPYPPPGGERRLPQPPLSEQPSTSSGPSPTTPTSTTSFTRDFEHAQDAGPVLLPPAYDPAWRANEPRPTPPPRPHLEDIDTSVVGGSSSADHSQTREEVPQVVRDTKRLLGVHPDMEALKRQVVSQPLSPFADAHAVERKE